MSLLFNMLSRLIITFLPRSKHLLISQLQSLSAVILEPPQNKVSHCFPISLLGSSANGSSLLGVSSDRKKGDQDWPELLLTAAVCQNLSSVKTVSQESDSQSIILWSLSIFLCHQYCCNPTRIVGT